MTAAKTPKPTSWPGPGTATGRCLLQHAGVRTSLGELRQHKDTLLAIQDRVGLFGYDNEGQVPALSAKTIYRVMDSFVGKWPKVPLPSSWGSGSPKGEVAYRFLHRLPWRLGSDTPRGSFQ